MWHFCATSLNKCYNTTKVYVSRRYDIWMPFEKVLATKKENRWKHFGTFRVKFHFSSMLSIEYKSARTSWLLGISLICLNNLVSAENKCLKQFITESIHLYLSEFEERGHFCPDINFEILICSESIGNQLLFNACFMFIAVWIHLLCMFKVTSAKRETKRIAFKS